MIAPERLAVLRRRVVEYQTAFATFARIHEELLSMKKKAAIGAAQEKIDAMVGLNREVAESVKRILTAAENELQQAETEIAASDLNLHDSAEDASSESW